MRFRGALCFLGESETIIHLDAERLADGIKILTAIISYPEARTHARTHARARDDTHNKYPLLLPPECAFGGTDKVIYSTTFPAVAT